MLTWLELPAGKQILEKLQTFSKENPTGWILGEGWDQNDWENKNYPDLTIIESIVS